MHVTVFGSTGFIGSHVTTLARSKGFDVICPRREESLQGRDLGHVIYAIGLTSDFRTRLHDTIHAHVTKLQEVLTQSTFDSLVYLSSTRVYARCVPVPHGACAGLVTERDLIPVCPTDQSDIYNLSKLMGESICLAHGPNVRVARLSNVVGPDFESDNFLISVVRDCIQHGRVELKTSLQSQKDYIAVADVANLVLRLGTEGRQSIYNVASGRNTTNSEIVDLLSQLTGAKLTTQERSPTTTFPLIDTSQIRQDLDYAPQAMEDVLAEMVEQFRDHFHRTTKDELP